MEGHRRKWGTLPRMLGTSGRCDGYALLMAIAARIRKQIELVHGASGHQKFCSNAASSLEVERSSSHAPRITLIDVFLAIDVWSAGMILLFFLTGKFPIFNSNDDTEALIEIAAIIGRRKMEKTATLHSKPNPYLSYPSGFE